ncbi:MAG: dinuclear metal center YbgI/SA1388 family protein [Gammaproteobacteria bacterium]|jgi:dinuclear metal center YbgI/SA1388 family protein
MQLQQLSDFCADYLRVNDFKDYCPNGLQVESVSEVKSIVSGVTASLDLIEAAIDVQADTLLVHHGYFWKGESPAISGFKGRRIRALIKNNINLLAYHLPLDAHPVVGNNAQIANIMGWEVQGTFASVGLHDIVFHTTLKSAITLDELTNSIANQLNTTPLSLAAGDKPIKSIAWCTGAAQGYIDQAVDRGFDVFISGEVSEHTFHYAKECGIHYIAAGHHATERYGVQALGSLIAETFGLKHQFIDILNPV